MARTATFKTKPAIAAALNDAENLSRFLALQLVNQGYLKAEAVPTGKRGRKPIEYVLTGKARSLLALAKTWKKKEAA